MKIQKILVANRGEIALRIIKTIRELGLDSVAIYSDADFDGNHVHNADEAVFIPNGYLDQDQIIQKAKEMNVDAIHPGYGFLSENADFCRKVISAKIKWIGPDPETIELMGDKINSKELCLKEGIPTLLKTTNAKDATKIGYPILVKASAGGGGKGMRIVENKKDLDEAIDAAKREAKSSFGDERIFLEKYIRKSRHIEVQILGDNYGNVVHLYERECSIQRRHQKIIEESPSPRLTSSLRSEITKSAVTLASKIGYKSAGTVEYLFDEDTNEFWFLEVNTRLQVEHPVTELVTSVDLVKEQIKIVEGKKLSFKQKDIKQNGSAIEVRLYAENPKNNFLPEIGQIAALSYPDSKSVRWDIGIKKNDVITPNFDPMLAKIIAYGETRKQATSLLRKELENTHLAGIRTNKEFLIKCLENSSFKRGKTTSDFIERESKKLFVERSKKDVDILMKIATLWTHEKTKEENTRLAFLPRNWTNGTLPKSYVEYEYEEELFCYEYTAENQKILINRKLFERISTSTASNIKLTPEGIALQLDERFITAKVTENKDNITLNDGFGDIVFKKLPKFSDLNELIIEGSLTAPMPGKILKINIKKGSQVSQGEALIILEAMKMEHTIKANTEGTVTEVFVNVGDQVENGADLMKVE